MRYRPFLKFAPALALLVLVLAFFARLAFSNLILARGDMFLYFYPNWSYAADAIRHGRLPLWNPYLFMGVPFLANSQTGVLYPFNLLLAWLPVTRAINASILLHVWLAGAGSYLFARRSLQLSRLAACVGAVTFALGGYLDAQVEHVNQLQALAWIPFLFLFFDRALVHGRAWFALAAVVAVQLLAGHTQSVYISLVGLGLYALWPVVEGALRRPRHLTGLARRLALWLGAAFVGMLLAAVQLVPTLELARQSMRSGGLSWREAISFSLKPALLGQALLPNYRQAIFSEYVAYLGVFGLALMILGVWACWMALRHAPAQTQTPPTVAARALSVLALAGLLLALGGYNPLYSLLLKLAPGFNLFRVPARWLALYAFAGAMLAGLGLDWLGAQITERRLRIAPLPLIAGGFGYWRILLAALVVVDLFLAGRPLDYNQPTAPDALTDLRPSTAHLMAHSPALSRFLSISPILFDPGDSAELKSIFADQLSQDAFYDLLIATKEKEIIAPNLSLYYRLSAADGYDGGVLPLRNYVTFQSLFVPPDKVSPDGRLRENLRDVPDARWLSLMNVRYAITDKTLDAWLDGVFYDLQFTTALGRSKGERGESNVAGVPAFDATALGLVTYLQGATNLPDGAPVAEVMVGLSGVPTQTFTLRAGVDTAEGVYTGTVAHRQARVGGHFVRDHPEFNDYVTRLQLGRPLTVTSVSVRPLLDQGQIVVRGASLIDERTGGFQSLVISGRGRFRLVHSGDVKIYENLDVLPRAFVAQAALGVPDDASALAAMRDPAFEPAHTVVLSQPQVSSVPAPSPSAAPSSAQIVRYDPERIVVQTDGASAGWLVLADAWYPGWHATIDGTPAEIARADVLFRAVPVPAGRHVVEFAFAPVSLQLGAAISLVTLLVFLLALVIHLRRSRRSGPRDAA